MNITSGTLTRRLLAGIQAITSHYMSERVYPDRDEHWLHGTCVMTRWAGTNRVTLNLGEHRTLDTIRTVNRLLDTLCGHAAIYRHQGRWLIETLDDDRPLSGDTVVRSFVDGMTISVGPVYR